ncbi:MAG: SxtJ family membrane protein [Balneolaceae bacterium]
MLKPRTLDYIRKDPTTAKTQLVIVTGLLVIGAIFQNEIFAYAALIIGVLSLAIPAAGNYIVWGWYKLAEGLGWFNSRVLLSIVYYLIVTPIALLFRLFGNDPLLLKESKGSMFHFKDHTFRKEDLENPW